jgi:hypothetical protein
MTPVIRSPIKRVVRMDCRSCSWWKQSTSSAEAVVHAGKYGHVVDVVTHRKGTVRGVVTPERGVQA